VYSCSSLPHGFSFRYIYGIFGMTCQLCVCLLLLMHESLFEKAEHTHPEIKALEQWTLEHIDGHVAPRATATPPPNISEQQAHNDNTLRPRRRRNSVPHAYSALEQIEF
jgi:hypothetical protein